MIHIIYITIIVVSILVTWYIGKFWWESCYQPVINEQYREIEQLANIEMKIKQYRTPQDDEQPKPVKAIDYRNTSEMRKQHDPLYNTYWDAENEFTHNNEFLNDIYGKQQNQ